MIPVFIGTTFLIFVMVYAVGDPVNAMFGDRAPDPATAAQLRSEFNLDKPLWQQYVLYMGKIFTGDFGNAFTGQPVTELMGTPFRSPSGWRSSRSSSKSSSASPSACSPGCGAGGPSTPRC